MSLVTMTAERARAYGGLVPEDVVDKVWQLMEFPLPFTDMIGAGTTGSSVTSWLEDDYAAPDLTNAIVDGADASGTDNNRLPTRVQNICQIMDKEISASNRARDGKTLGMGDPFQYQFERRLVELKRDLEAIALSPQGSVHDAGGSTPGKLGGLDAIIKTHAKVAAGGAAGGFNSSTGLIVAPTAGTAARALTETLVRDTMQEIYQDGGNPSVIMATPTVIRKFSSYMFTGSAQIATLSSDVAQKRTGAVATGSVNVYATDFGIICELTANRIQQPTATNVSTMFILDPSGIEYAYLQRPVMHMLAKAGLSDKGQLYCDATLRVWNERHHGSIRDIDETAAVTT